MWFGLSLCGLSSCDLVKFMTCSIFKRGSFSEKSWPCTGGLSISKEMERIRIRQGEAAWWGHYTPSKCKRRFVLLFCLFINIIFFIGDLELDREEWGFLLVFEGWVEEWMGLLGLHRSVFFWKIRGFLFSVYWAFFFFLVGLPVTIFFLKKILGCS